MNTKIFLIAGTQDGRELAKILLERGFDVTASVVSDYGKKLLETCAGVKINDKPLDADELEKILRGGNFSAVVDASHPYAQNVSANAIRAAQSAKIFYVRYERAQVEVTGGKIFHVDSYESAAVKASELGKNIFITTGSRNLKTFVESPALKDCNLTVRILPTAEVLAQCETLGLSPKQIIAIQGRFSTALNVEMFKHANAEVIVTKNSGTIGGADTKLEAAEILNLPVVMIDRPKIDYPNLAATFADVLELIRNLE
ncbi:MAG: precorrin-6A reductase [Selenomonadaceae bacterium]|nr:precorrin-6A reductase [Selenomonadaceae bacterium]